MASSDEGFYPQMTQMSADEGDPRTSAIIGAAMEVHGTLGQGFLEAVYQEALAIELARRPIHFQRQARIVITYKGRDLRALYRADSLCFESIILDIKALARQSPVEDTQILNYLKASGLNHGLLLNFGAPSLEYKRLILSKTYPRTSASSVDENAP